MSQLVVGDSEAAVLSRCIREGLRVAVGFVKSGLTISPKSVVVASSCTLATRIAGALTKAGQPIEASRTAEDLGISSGCGARRAVGAAKKRLARGAARARRVQRLTRANPKASKLYSTGVQPQQSYGMCIPGASPSQLRIMRRSAVLTVARAGVQPCTTTILQWRLGRHRDPAIALPVEQVKMWIRLWERASKRQRNEIRLAWARGMHRVLLGGVRWMKVTGPMQATMAVLGGIGWRPVAPDKWIDAAGDQYAELGWSPFANASILDTLTVAFERAAWVSASSHFLGRGLESGTPVLEPARSARRWFRKRELWKELKALDCVVCGGVWSGFRMRHPEKCKLCGAEDVDAYHRYWACPGLAEHADESVSSTQWMRRLFDERYARFECLWGRGILPAALIGEMEHYAADNVHMVSSPAFLDLVAKRAEAFTDGSGGPRWVPTLAKQTGSAVATVGVRSTGATAVAVEDVGLQISRTPGRPAVPRAELWAAILAARAATAGQRITIQVDAAYVVKGLSGKTNQMALKAGSNGDLWTALLDLVQAKSLDIHVCKVKSHAEIQVLLGEVSLEAFLGNVLADAGAEVAAENAVHSHAAQDLSQWEGITFLVARRLAVIEASLWDEGPRLVPAPAPMHQEEPPAPPEATKRILSSIGYMGHRLHHRGNFLYCAACRRRRKSTSSRFWMKTPCDGLSAAAQDVAAMSPPSVSEASTVVEVAEPELVTPAKRRRLLAEQRRASRESTTACQDAHLAAWRMVASGLPSSAAVEGFVPAELHATHDCWACGGFVGCKKCGSIVSTSQRSALAAPCRGRGSHSAMAAVKRLSAGELPRGAVWPSGELCPRPKRIRYSGV